MYRLACLFAVLVLLGCVKAQTTMLGGAPQLAPITVEEVSVFLSEADVPGEYFKVAVIHAQGEGTWTNEAKMIKKAKEEAAKIGANGIIMGAIDEPSAGAKVAGAIFGTGTTRRGEAIAIRYEVKENQPQQDNNDN